MAQYRGNRTSGQKNRVESGMKNTFIIALTIIVMLTIGLSVTFGIKKVNFMLTGAVTFGFCLLALLPWFNHWFWKVYGDQERGPQIWKSFFPCRFFYKGPMILFIVGIILLIITLVGYFAPEGLVTAIYGDFLVGQTKFMYLLRKATTISIAILWISLAWGYTGMARDVLYDINVINQYKAYINSAAPISRISNSTSANSVFVYIFLWIPLVQFFSIGSLGYKLLAIADEQIPIDVMEDVLEKAENGYEDEEGSNDYYDDSDYSNSSYDYDFEDEDNDYY